MTNDSNQDAILHNEWLPVAIAHSLGPGQMTAVVLLEQNLVLWRDSAGQLHAWQDRCPHRGMKLSMGSLQADQLTCPYHGWQYGTTGKCQFIPALPMLKEGNLKAQVKTYLVQEHYGLIWVCLAESAPEIFKYPEFFKPELRKVWCGPYEVASSAPRIIENFLDMGHFAYVHEGILGDLAHTEIANYDVESFDDAEYGQGIRAKNCYAWQPQASKSAAAGSEVEYTYRVVRPLTAILTKQARGESDLVDAISLHLQPINQTTTRAWIVMALNDSEHSDEELGAFQDHIFLQDKPIVENQQPQKLPLLPQTEVSVACDKMSLAYRQYLIQINLRYGTLRND